MKHSSLPAEINVLLHHLERHTPQSKPFLLCQQLADYVILHLDHGRHDQASACMARIFRIYQHTEEQYLRTAIENAFIRGLGRDMLRPGRREHLLRLLPRLFREVLVAQMSSSDF